PVLEAGEWFLAVINRSPVGSEQPTYRLRATQQVDIPVTPLIAGVWATNTIPGIVSGLPAQLNYYSFDVSAEATTASFQMTGAEGELSGNLDLLLKYEAIPGPGDFDAASVNSGRSDETILLNAQSQPLLQPGRWYVAVINRTAEEVDYQIMANVEVAQKSDEHAVIDPVVVYHDGTVCLEWDSLQDRLYTVQGRARLTDTQWVDLATVEGSGLGISHCLELPVDYTFFRILESEQPEPEPVDG
ncbi:MAG: PPC domain-containing protein, partial [Verrucomicrobiota bacterium]